MFPKRMYNPHLPLSAGAPGLMFSPRRDVLGPSWRLFIQNGNKSPITYNFYGDYSATCVGYLTKEEFASLQPAVSRSIVHFQRHLRVMYMIQTQDSLVSVAFKRTYLECQAIRARVALRKNGALPSDPNALATLVKQQLNKGSKKGPRLASLQKEDVHDAFLAGQEVRSGFQQGDLSFIWMLGVPGDTAAIHWIQSRFRARYSGEVPLIR